MTKENSGIAQIIVKYFLFIALIIVSTHLNSAQILTLADNPKMMQESSKSDSNESNIDSLKILVGAQVGQKIRLKACNDLYNAIKKSENIDITLVTDLLFYYNDEYDLEVKHEILTCLGYIYPKSKDERITDLFVNIIKTKDLNVYFKTRAISICTCFSGDKRIRNELLGIIKQDPPIENTEWLRSAAVTLGKMKCKEAIPILIEKMVALLRNADSELFKTYTNDFCELEPPPTVGDELVGFYSSGLSFMDGEEVISALKPLLTDENKRLNYHGAIMLGYFGDTTVVPILCDIVINSKDHNMRICAIYHLSNIGDKKAIPALKKALSDNYRDINGIYRLRYDAYKALLKLGVKVETKGRNEYKVVE